MNADLTPAARRMALEEMAQAFGPVDLPTLKGLQKQLLEALVNNRGCRPGIDTPPFYAAELRVLCDNGPKSGQAYTQLMTRVAPRWHARIRTLRTLTIYIGAMERTPRRGALSTLTMTVQ